MKRVLTLDGGGVKGMFSVAFLAHLEASLNRPISEYFDLIVGTSAGGIVAIGLGLGMTARQILELYRHLGPSVFGASGWAANVRGLFRPKYDQSKLKLALVESFGDRLLGDSAVRLVIPSQSLQTGRVHIYKTAHEPRLATDWKVPAVDVALATSAAPTYFRTFRSPSNASLVDGGTWANNPVAVGVVEGLGILRWEARDMHVLSVGCTEAPLDLRGGGRFGSGQLHWATQVVELLLAGQNSGALGMATHPLLRRASLSEHAGRAVGWKGSRFE